jgi:hypothetical protein
MPTLVATARYSAAEISVATEAIATRAKAVRRISGEVSEVID